MGVLIDQELRFKEHGALALAKGTAWVMQFRRLAKPAGGIPAQYVRRLYYGIAVPRMLYAADVWCPPHKRTDRNKTSLLGPARPLMAVQRMAALMTTGALRSTATDTAEAHADMLPLPLLRDKICQRATLRIASLPESHPLHARVKRAARNYVNSHRAPLHELTNAYKIEPAKMETIAAVRHHPKWKPRIKAVIAQSKETAIANDAADDEFIRVYSDGSGYEGGIGAAAVLIVPGESPKVLRFHLGPDTEHTVYEAEVVGAALGAELLHKRRTMITKAALCIDNQAAILATQSIRPAPGHHLVDTFHSIIAKVTKKHRGVRLEARWVPGHKDIMGNEMADVEAKRAAQGESSSTRLLPMFCRPDRPIATSRAAAKQEYQSELKKQAKEMFKKSPRYPKLRRIDATVPSNRFRKIAAALPRRQAALLMHQSVALAP